jgi:hypothetical protein
MQCTSKTLKPYQAQAQPMQRLQQIQTEIEAKTSRILVWEGAEWVQRFLLQEEQQQLECCELVALSKMDHERFKELQTEEMHTATAGVVCMCCSRAEGRELV